MWLAFGDCGDFYCDGDHPLGVFSSEENARWALDKYKEGHTGRDGSLGEYLVDVLNPDYFDTGVI
jgi:hypothetical protein